MRYKTTKLISASVMAFACAQAALCRAADNPISKFAGTWEGRMNDQPALEVTITTDNGRIGGTIIFYFQRMGKDGKWRVEGDSRPQALIGPKVDGNTLTFEVVHHKQHGSSELGPNKTFRLEVTATDEGRFREAGDPSDIQGHGLKLTRRSPGN